MFILFVKIKEKQLLGEIKYLGIQYEYINPNITIINLVFLCGKKGLDMTLYPQNLYTRNLALYVVVLR